MANDMTPYEQARDVADKLGMDFERMIADHLSDGYVYSSPDCFICAMDTARDFGEYAEPGIFVTLAVGSLDHFISIDPHKDRRKWLGFCREEDGEVHWLPYSRLLKSNHI
jgi:hypothetical protein